MGRTCQKRQDISEGTCLAYFSYGLMVLVASPAPFISHTAQVIIHAHQRSVKEKLVEEKQLCKWNLSAHFPLARLCDSRHFWLKQFYVGYIDTG